MPAGVCLDSGTGFADAFGQSGQIEIIGKTDQFALVACENGVTVEFLSGLVLIMNDGIWTDKSTGKTYSHGCMEKLDIK